MSSQQTARVIDRSGQSARIAWPSADDRPVIAILDSGMAVQVPAALMIPLDSETYTVTARFEDLPCADPPTAPPQGDRPEPVASSETIIPVVAERARVDKERVVTGRVRLRKVVHQEEQTIDEPVLKERVSVERIPIDRWIDTAPPIRSEGETLIVPVVEEVLVVEKRLRLREEVRVTWHQREEHEPQHLMVRCEEIRIERMAGEQSPPAAGEDGTPPASAGGSDEAEPRP